MSGIAAPERKSFARFTPYLQSRNMRLVRTEAARHAATLEQFLAQPELKVAVIKGFRHGGTCDTWLKRLRKQGRVHETADYGKRQLSLAITHNFSC
jgi:polar amino acid transport system substrate-binding protein